MAFSNNRHSIYSNTSGSPFQGVTPVGQTGNLTSSALLAALHNAYLSGTTYQLDAATTLVVNSAVGQSPNSYVGIYDEELGTRVWEHARRRAEDQTIVLASLHSPAPSLLTHVLSTLPASSDVLLGSLSLIQAFTSCLTPYSPYSLPHHRGLAVALSLSLNGAITGAQISLSSAGLDLEHGLLHIPEKPGFRAFDVFYYLLSAVTTEAEREAMGLEDPGSYALLSRSNTYNLPSYLPTADDSVAAEDWRANLRAIGIKGGQLRGLLSVLAGLLKLGNSVGLLVDGDVVEEVCEDVGVLLEIDPEVLSKKMSDAEREIFIGSVYEMLVEWIISKANEALTLDFAARKDTDSNIGGSEDGDIVQITILEIADDKMARAICMKGVFDDDYGLNSEMKSDNLEVPPVSSTIVRELKSAWSDAESGGLVGTTREKEYEADRREQLLERVGHEVEDGGFLRTVLFPEEFGRSRQAVQIDAFQHLAASRAWYHLSLSPSEEEVSGPGPQNWSAGVVSKQLRHWRLPEWANRRSKRIDFTADFDFDEFATRYAPLGCSGGQDGVESWVFERGYSNGEVAIGTERVWMREGCWWESESMLDIKQPGVIPAMMGMGMGPIDTGYTANTTASGYFQPALGDSQAHFSLLPQQHTDLPANDDPRRLLEKYNANHYQGNSDAEIPEANNMQEQPVTFARRLWVGFVWACTFWIPSFVLRYLGRMKRPDVRFAWREKIVLFALIVIANAAVIFWIAFFANILCPDIDKAWNSKEVGYHTGESDYWASFNGRVYDFTKFSEQGHGKQGQKVDMDRMIVFAGKDLTPLFPKPLYKACPNLITESMPAYKQMRLTYNDTEITALDSSAIHETGDMQPDQTLALKNENWYANTFLNRIKKFKKGDLVWDKKDLKTIGKQAKKPWAIINGKVYDLTDYAKTHDTKDSAGSSKNSTNMQNWYFLGDKLESLFNENRGEDITKKFYEELGDDPNFDDYMTCLENMFYVGIVDFRKDARCVASGYVLLAAAALMASVILIKFVAALQLGSKRRPAMQDKFVICQIPAYTEGEDSLRKALDSLTALNYDNKRKLMVIICDGMVVGGGNDRPTPSIVLDILGVDPKTDPPRLPFKSVGEGAEQLNFGKVYSGLYEYEGCVVPYIVVVKVGNKNETNKPGNRGKRDSQILLLDFLNKVHHRAPMSPLQLEMFHQINNIIGVDPEMYEFLLMVDADTSVMPDSLNRLVAACAHDSNIVGICGETSLENEEGSWWTMVQVYEYYISHNLAKAFESLFGSVTCLPGCFCMYRLRTADRGKPLIVSSKVVEAYSDGVVDTLHKKNLLSLGEDRYLTTLMMREFPHMSMKFIPDAYASTAAPETLSVLLSQRRRWINSTIHNLAELIFLESLCGFCCFSMRFVVLLDLVGTIILPATCIYIGYLIYVVVEKGGQIPWISIGMLAGVYGLQALIFILKRRWQHIGWMIVYIIAFPFHAFILPVYSFWKQDDFSWGNTRIVVGEKNGKKLVAAMDTFNPADIPLKTWEQYAIENNLPGPRRGVPGEKYSEMAYQDNGYEMDDMQSMYSSVKPASTILAGLPHVGSGQQAYLPPQSPAPFGASNHRQSQLSVGGVSTGDYWQDGPRGHIRSSPMSTTDNLLGHTPPPRAPTRSPLGFSNSRPASTIDFMRMGNGPDDESIVYAIREVLGGVNLENVTKKQVRALVEQKLQTECQGERRQFLDNQIDMELANM